MGIFRNVNVSFWTDTKVVDEYTPEDKYFMLYAMTNQYTNIIGCYEISLKQMSYDLGYTKDVVQRIIKRFKTIHKTIDYDEETKELLIINWSKYNWSASPKLDKPLYTNIEKIKSSKFHDYLAKIYNSRESIKNNDTLSIPYRYPMDTTISIAIPITRSITSSISNTITNTNTISNTITNTNTSSVKEKTDPKIFETIIEYLNNKTGMHYKHTTSKTQSLINARLNEGFTISDFYTVIDKKCLDWLNDPKWSKYLRPETLFGTKFESYLNQPKKEVTTKDLPVDENFMKEFF